MNKCPSCKFRYTTDEELDVHLWTTHGIPLEYSTDDINKNHQEHLEKHNKTGTMGTFSNKEELINESKA